MRLEFHQLDLRYGATRALDRARQSQLTASLAEHGQLTDVLVVAAQCGHVLIDGYRRLAALKSLGRDEVEAAELPMGEAEALVLCHRLARGDRRSCIEEAWLLQELVETHGKGLRELALELDRTVSWVSRRLGLLTALPECAQQAVREGRLVAHAAMRYLVPLARANTEHCEILVRSIWDDRLSVRQLGRVYIGWRRADEQRRHAIVTQPHLFLKADEAQQEETPASPELALVKALDAVSGTSHRALKQLRSYRERPFASTVRLSWQQAQAAFVRLSQELVGSDA
jgi:ParB-like chromosome segregation protein Spo0J